MRNCRRGCVFLLCLLATPAWWACGGGDDPPDASADAALPSDGGEDGGPVELCARNADCDDGVFCNGREQCMPGADEADARGCVAAEAPCMAGQSCSEEMDRCESDCASAPDSDGDGYRAVNCGGDDCDDSDGAVNPGSNEICDAEGRDEDCDPNTLDSPEGTDTDSDGFVSDACCNIQRTGALLCGLDCDDNQPTARFGLPEVCDGLDNDCDDSTDEDVQTTYYRDQDTDLYGASDDTVSACAQPDGYTANPGDCDDSNGDVNPGASEQCGGADEDCDGRMDEEVSPAPATAEHCGACGATCPTGYTCNVDVCEDAAVQVAAGRDFLCVRTSSGRVHCHGRTSEWASTPTVVPGLGTSNDIAAAGGQACAIDDAHQVRCWGLDPISGVFRTSATAIDVPDGAILLALGGRHACAVSTSGVTYCWGKNDIGQIGNDTTIDQPTPVAVGVPVPARALAAGHTHTCVLDETGNQITCWGDNSLGQYGASFVGMNELSPASTASTLLGNRGLGGGGGVGCAHGDTGLSCWGSNSRREAGALDGATRNPPGPIGGLESLTIAEMASERNVCLATPAAPPFPNATSCALSTLGSVACWGDPRALGIGPVSAGPTRFAVPVASLVDARSLDAGLTSGQFETADACGVFFCAATDRGTVDCWGSNPADFLRAGTTFLLEPRPLNGYPVEIAPAVAP